MKNFTIFLLPVFLLASAIIFAQNTNPGLVKITNQQANKSFKMADGNNSRLISASHQKPGASFTYQTDESTIRYDDGINFDAIGLTVGGTFQVAAYFPAETMAQYVGLKLTKMEFYINDVPNPCKIKVYGQGTSNSPGALLHEETVSPAGLSWNLFALSAEIEITGEDLWIGYEVTHLADEKPAGCDDGPAVAGFGDMFSLDGVSWESLFNYGYNYNWNLVGYINEGSQPHVNDVGVIEILSPVSGTNLGDEVVTIEVKNFGTASQSNIPVFFTVDGGTPFNGIVAGPLASGATVEYTFPGTTFFGEVGHTYILHTCTALANDEVPGNNCKTEDIVSGCCIYCDASTSYENEYIASVLCGNINNSSGWQGGVADYTAMSTPMAAGTSIEITVQNGLAYPADKVYVWVDWNKDYTFGTGDEQFILPNIYNSGEIFNGIIIAQAGTPDGEYRMRIRMILAADPLPCGNSPRGEVEDYTIVVGNIPVIVVNPTSVTQYVPFGGGAESMLAITNTGNDDLTYNIEVEYPTAAKVQPEPYNAIEAEARLAARMADDGLVSTNVELAPGSVFGGIQQSDDQFDLLFEYPCGNTTGEAGVETDGNFIYTSLWNGTEFCKYAPDGTYLGTFSIPGVSAVRDMAYHDTYFYGAAANTTVFEMDFTTQTLISTFVAPTATRAIAYDELEDGFYGNNWSTPIVLYDRTGATLTTIPTAGDESYYGFANVPFESYLWAYSQKVGTSQNMLYKINLPAGTIAESFDMLTILSLPTPGTDIAGGLYYSIDLINNHGILGGIVQDICLWGIELYHFGPPEYDVGVNSFVSPVTGPDLGEEIVTVRVKNYGSLTQTNIPVSYTLDGGTPVTGIVPGPIAAGRTEDFTFPGTVNLSNPGQVYVFMGCTALVGEENPGNDCKTVSITNMLPGYCAASTTTEDEYIANVLCGEINNSSGWQGGVADYTMLTTTIEAGSSELVTITNGNPWASDCVTIWVDWNEDFTFSPGTNEEFILTNVGGTGASFTGAVAVSAGQANGSYRMRIRMMYSYTPTPCDNATYGEVEDYTIEVPGCCPDDWLSVPNPSGTVAPGATANVPLYFYPSGLELGSYAANLKITNNSGNSPVLDVPVTMNVVSEIGLVVEPMSLTENHPTPPMLTTQQLTVTNNGNTTVDFDVVVNTTATVQQKPVNTPEDFARLFERMTADGLISKNVERAPGSVFGEIQYADAEYDLQFEYPCGDATGEAGIETDGNYIYTTLWNGNQFCKYNTDGTFIGLFGIPGASACRDLAYDGTYFYGAAANTTVFQMDFNTNSLVGTINAPTSVRAIAYDDEEDGFWANNWSTPIVLFDRSGVTINTIQTAGDEFYYGFAYQPANYYPPYLWGYSQKTGTSLNMLYKIMLPDGTIVEEFDMMSILTMPQPGNDIAGGLFLYPDLVAGTITLGGLVQNICIWGIEVGITFTIPDVGVTAFLSPTSGPDLGEEIVTIIVKNFGGVTLANIPVSYTLDGGTPVTGIEPGPIALGETAEFTFPGTVNLSQTGQTYVFVGCTALEGDLNPANNCKTFSISYMAPSYCDASTTTEDEYIANVLCGEINNSSGWQGGVADYTAISATINSGESEEITITNGTPWASDKVTVWVDWNMNYEFDMGTNEEFILTNVGGTGAIFNGSINVPLETPPGFYRMRTRMTYSTAPQPCGSASYGEIEDYTIKVPSSPVNSWLSADPITGSLAPGQSTTINVTFNSEGMTGGEYAGTIVFNSNDPVNPVITVPAILTCCGIPPCNLPPPQNLWGYEILPNIAHLSWEAPGIPGNLLGYNIYRNNQKINTDIVSNLFYEDSLTNPQQYFYHITAVYPECEASSDTISLVITNLPEKESHGMTIFPNPATNFVNIKSQHSINQVSILNNLGQVVFSGDFENNNVQVNTSGFNKGIYIVQVKTMEGSIAKKLVIQ